MKWFHHECLARYNSKLQILGSTHGAEGIGIYWGLLEEIGRHSDTFHMKITGLGYEIDRNNSQTHGSLKDLRESAGKIPELPIKILARNLFTSQKKVLLVIKTCTEIELFDLHKWSNFSILYSHSFEQRADDYTRRLQRKLSLSACAEESSHQALSRCRGIVEETDKVRTDSEQPPDNARTRSEESPNSLRSEFAKVLLDTEAEQEQKKNSDISMHARVIDYDLLKNEPYLVELDETGVQEYCRAFRSKIVEWNDGRQHKFEWNPSDNELRKLFLGGPYEHKVSMCYEAYKILHEKIHYPELVLRALQLMLKASGKTRIVNPLGWMWSCMHGNGDATTPWVQLLTAEEESSIVPLLQKRIANSHPP